MWATVSLGKHVASIRSFLRSSAVQKSLWLPQWARWHSMPQYQTILQPAHHLQPNPGDSKQIKQTGGAIFGAMQFSMSRVRCLEPNWLQCQHTHAHCHQSHGGATNIDWWKLARSYSLEARHKLLMSIARWDVWLPRVIRWWWCVVWVVQCCAEWVVVCCVGGSVLCWVGGGVLCWWLGAVLSGWWCVVWVVRRCAEWAVGW